MRARILIVEPESAERKRLVDSFEGSRIQVFEATDLTSVSSLCSAQNIEAILLSNTRLEEGSALLTWFKGFRTPSRIPVLLVGEDTSVHVRETALQAGAADYVSSSAGSELLLARMETLFLRKKSQTSASLVPRGFARRVLVIDDSLTYAHALMEDLRKDGHDLAFAETGQAGLSYLASNKVELAIVDVFLPDMNGVEVCRQLKTDPQTAHVPVLVLTGREHSAVRASATDAMADDFAVKSRDFSGISAKVRTMLARNDTTPKRAVPARAVPTVQAARTSREAGGAAAPERENDPDVSSAVVRVRSGSESLEGEALFEALVQGTGLSRVLARSTVETVCRRLDVEPKSLDGKQLRRVVSELERSLNLFLPESEARTRLAQLNELVKKAG